MLAAVYLQPSDVPLLTGAQYAEVAADPDVALAAPIAFGDSYDGAPVVGTTAEFVTHLAGDLTEGRIFATSAEAVAGAFAPVVTGETFTPAHGHGPAAEADAHEGAGLYRHRPHGAHRQPVGPGDPRAGRRVSGRSTAWPTAMPRKRETGSARPSTPTTFPAPPPSWSAPTRFGATMRCNRATRGPT
jgi:hypothetical protein